MEPEVWLLEIGADLGADLVSDLGLCHVDLPERPVLCHQLPKVAILRLLELVLLQAEALELGVDSQGFTKDLHDVVEVRIEVLSHQGPHIAELVELAEYVLEILWGVSRAL